MQMETVECGAASLAMVLAYYGKWLSLEQLRADCGVSRDGCNARNIVLAARTYGLKAQGWRAEISDLPDMCPCIIHWRFNQFVVLKGFKKDKVYLNDPAIGSIVVSMEEFSLSFTENITLTPLSFCNVQIITERKPVYKVIFRY